MGSLTRVAIGAVAGLAAGIVQAGETVTLYQNDFESASSIGNEWSSPLSFASHSNFSRFVGRYSSHDMSLNVAIPPLPDDNDAGGGNGGYTLETLEPALGRDREPLPDSGGTRGPGGVSTGSTTGYVIDLSGREPPEPVVYSVLVDLYLFDSWDGNADGFEITVNGESLFNELFSNFNMNANYRLPDVGPTDLGYSHWDDTIYRDLRVDFELAPGVDSVDIGFRGWTDQTLDDESWGMDNVRLIRHDGSLGVVPTPGALGLLAAAGLCGSRRRRRS